MCIYEPDERLTRPNPPLIEHNKRVCASIPTFENKHFNDYIK
jgi:hypothetical protein